MASSPYSPNKQRKLAPLLSHPVDRSFSKPLPRFDTKYGSSILLSPSRGLGLLQQEVEAPNAHVPTVDQLRAELRRAGAADDITTVCTTSSTRDDEDIDSILRRCRAIRDAATQVTTECSGVRPLIMSICDAYDQQIRRLASAGRHMSAAAAVQSRGLIHQTLVELSSDEAFQQDAAADRYNVGAPSSPLSVEASMGGMPSSSAATPSSKRQLAEQLREAQQIAVQLGAQLEHAEREREVLQAAGEQLRQASEDAQRKLHAALSGLSKASLLEGVSVSELEAAALPLHQVDGVTLLLFAKSWRRREEDLLSQIEQLTAGLAQKEVMLHTLAAQKLASAAAGSPKGSRQGPRF